MSLLKLSNIAHGRHLAIHGRALFSNRIQAWQYGPVIPEMYSAFRDQGISPQNTVPGYPAEFNEGTERFLEQIYNIYGDMSPFRLSELTHVPSGRWDIAIKVCGLSSEIPDDLIRLHYKKKLAKA